MRILLVEDEPELAKLFIRVLKGAGYAVDHTDSGAQAIYWAKINDYDVAQIDGRLPDIDGFEVCRQIRLAKPGMLIIMTTVRSLTEDKRTAFAAGADDYLVKPFQIEELTMRIHALLRRPSMIVPDILEYNGYIDFDRHPVTGTRLPRTARIKTPPWIKVPIIGSIDETGIHGLPSEPKTRT